MSTLRDVAQKADVSITTVSRAINNPDKVSSDTLAHIRKTMRLLKYNPSRVAQRLRGNKGKSKLLGLIIPDIQNPFYSDIVRGIEDVSYGKKYAVILCNSDENPEKERFYLNVLHAESVDGVILPPIHRYGKVVKEIIELGIPLICIDRKFSKVSVDTVVVNNSRGAYTAVSHLIDMGHKRISMITSNTKFSSFEERKEGYKKALDDNGLAYDELLVKEADPKSSDDAKEATFELLKSKNPPTAIFVTNNLMGIGTLNATKEVGLKIPGDISLVMFDEMPWASIVSPALTTVKQPSYEMGRRAAELFFQRIEDPERRCVEHTMDTELIIRNSTAAPHK